MIIVLAHQRSINPRNVFFFLLIQRIKHLLYEDEKAAPELDHSYRIPHPGRGRKDETMTQVSPPGGGRGFSEPSDFLNILLTVN